MATTDWTVRLRSHDREVGEGRILESSTHRTPEAAMDAYRSLLARDELDGTAAAAVFKPPAGVVQQGNTSTWFSRFDRPYGDGRVMHDDPRLDPWAGTETVRDVQGSLPPEPPLAVDWERDERVLSDVLKSWHGARRLTRDDAAAALRVARSTYDGWCAGRRTSSEGMVRLVLTLLDREEARR